LRLACESSLGVAARSAGVLLSRECSKSSRSQT
jgi:hypothetical protein